MKCLLTNTKELDTKNRYKHKCVRCGNLVYSKYENSGAISMRCAAIEEVKPTRVARGPGTELKRIFADLGVTNFTDCNCDKKATQMDVWGVAGCRENFEVIRGWIDEAQKKASWSTKIDAAIAAATNGIALQINPTNIAGSLVRLAIERAENDTHAPL